MILSLIHIEYSEHMMPSTSEIWFQVDIGIRTQCGQTVAFGCTPWRCQGVVCFKQWKSTTSYWQIMSKEPVPHAWMTYFCRHALNIVTKDSNSYWPQDLQFDTHFSSIANLSSVYFIEYIHAVLTTVVCLLRHCVNLSLRHEHKS